MARRPKGWHPEDIKAAIRKRGSTLAGLSRSWGLSRNAVSVTIARSWPSTEFKIAKFLGVTPKEIWPKRYFPDGTPNKGHRATNKTKFTRRNTESNNQLSAAA